VTAAVLDDVTLAAMIAGGLLIFTVLAAGAGWAWDHRPSPPRSARREYPRRAGLNAHQPETRQPGLIWACPDCGADLGDAEGAMWCGACGRSVAYALLTDDADSGRDEF
jgi:hypothetical protein